MRRLLLALLLTLPTIVGGSLLAHAAGYALAEPDSALRAETLARSGHAYLDQPVLVLLVLLVVFAVGGLLCVDAELRGRGGRHIATWPFSLVAPAGFVVQEHLERLLHTGSLPLDLCTRPEFLLGLALQLPFALFAMWVARLLLRSTKEAVAALGLRRVRLVTPLPAPIAALSSPAAALPRSAALASCAAGRAPPHA